MSYCYKEAGVRCMSMLGERMVVTVGKWKKKKEKYYTKYTATAGEMLT